VEPEHVVVCCAASQALTVLWQALRAQGGRLCRGRGSWLALAAVHGRACRARGGPRAGGRGRLVVSELAGRRRGCSSDDAGCISIRPGVVMTAERRSALIRWTRERRALIVEDDYDVEYRLRPGAGGLPSGPGTGPGRVRRDDEQGRWAGPRLRLAWVVPPSYLIDDVENMLLVTGVTPPTLDQMGHGLVYRRRRARASSAFDAPRATAPSETS